MLSTDLHHLSLPPSLPPLHFSISTVLKRRQGPRMDAVDA